MAFAAIEIKIDIEKTKHYKSRSWISVLWGPDACNTSRSCLGLVKSVQIKVLHGQRLQKRNPFLYLYMFIAVTLTSSVPTACSRLTL